jgi:hypothetical protein
MLDVELRVARVEVAHDNDSHVFGRFEEFVVAVLAAVALELHYAFGPVQDVLVEDLADYVGAGLEVVYEHGLAFFEVVFAGELL